jgi:hypothetical protein
MVERIVVSGIDIFVGVIIKQELLGRSSRRWRDYINVGFRDFLTA